MLGYPTDFAQIECLRLIASPKFPEKRIGYLGLTLLLDEQSEVLMMVTNSIKRDLNNENPYVIGLALNALANVCSPAIARDLASEISRLLHDGNPFIRKKAALAAIRFIRKAPELLEDFASQIPDLVNGKNHGVLLSGLSLATEMLIMNRAVVKPKFSSMMNDLLRLLKNLTGGYAPEHEVSGIADPFLQCKIIKFLRLLVTGDEKSYDDFTDVLGNVSSNTDSTKNPGNAILYECVRTIMSINAEPSLRVMAVNILGRFLLNRENNIRYVALSTLCKCGKSDVKAIQRHRNTIVDCLKDPDISIRRRALDLVYSLVNKANVKALVKELVNYLVLASSDLEFRSDLTEKVSVIIEEYAPDPLWYIQMNIEVLKAAGSLTKERVASNLIVIIQQNPNLYAYSVHSLYYALKADASQAALVQVAVWAIGEYGNMLCDSASVQEANSTSEEKFTKVTEEDVVSVLGKALKNPVATNLVKEYTLTALCKLSTRFTHSNQKLTELVSAFTSSMNLELQSRSNEYANLMSSKLSSIRAEILAVIPPLELDVLKKRKGKGATRASQEIEGEEDVESAAEVETDQESVSRSPSPPQRNHEEPQKKPVAQRSSSLFDLDDLLSVPQSSASQPVAASAGDLLASLFPISSNTSNPVLPTVTSEKQVSPLVSESLFSDAPAESPGVEVFSKDGIRLVFKFEKKSPDLFEVLMLTSNSTSLSFSGFQILVAVPNVRLFACISLINLTNYLVYQINNAPSIFHDIICQDRKCNDSKD
jgi:AP-1 complex subunit gamma-1